MSKIGCIRVSTEHQETAGDNVRLSGPPPEKKKPSETLAERFRELAAIQFQ